jgi:ribonuclease HII
MMDYFYEQQIIDKGYKIVCGMDEAGRGPLAGAVFAAAVILPQGLIIECLNDSKKLTEKKRDKLFDVIKENAISYGIASVSAEEIDEINILNASMLAMRRAAEMLEPKPDAGLIDGNTSRGFTFYTETLVKGDSLSPSIAAASILAKVSRDRYMAELAEKYPEYNFAGHKGYPTKEHMDLVRKLGPCPEHRKTFLKFLNK